MRVAQIKGLLAVAAASAGETDTHWSADAVDRLYFFDPKNQETSGCVDVQRSADGTGPERVRLELWVEPSKAAEVIALVTGATMSLEATVRALVMSGSLSVREPAPALKPAPPPLSFGPAKPPTPEERQQERDEARSRELDALIAAQAKDTDEPSDEKPEKDEDEEDDGLPAEVEFPE